MKKIILCIMTFLFLGLFANSLFSKENTKQITVVEPMLELYVKHDCPYCKKVLSFLHEKNIKIDVKDAYNKENAHYLLDKGKKKQVPCLFIDGKPLYESDDIISFFQESKNNKAK